MIQSNQKTSLLIPSQLPAFIRDDPNYENFVLFLQAYYEWMEQSGGVTDGSKNLLSYKDIDETTSNFIEYFNNDFLPYFPNEILADKAKVTKIAKQLYQTKGTPASYQFLFRLLYNTEVDFFYTEDAVLKASAGTWYIARSLNLATDDPNFLNIANLRIFGETTKSIATIETSTFNGTKTEVFISNIERLFKSGEFVRVVDSNNQDVYFLNGQIVPSTTIGSEVLRAKVVGQISQIKIDPNNRGLGYHVGDPVVVYGGLASNTNHGATAVISATTAGSIQRISTDAGGYGYTNSPNTAISFSNLNAGSQVPIAVVGSLNPINGSNVSLVATDVIGVKQKITIGNTRFNFANNLTANVNTTLANALSFISFTGYPIGSVLVENGGGGLTQVPTITAQSLYQNETFAANNSYGNLANLGILAPIQIVSGGTGYRANDMIVFTGGSGYGAHANVTSVDANGSITGIQYVYANESPHHYPLGGMGYKQNWLPTVTVNSANTLASNASIYVPSILGAGSSFSAVVNRVGSVTSINITDPGTDYISVPNATLKVQDITVSNVSVINLPTKGDIVYQGQSLANSSYIATVDSIQPLYNFANSSQSIYNIRVFNYNNKPSYDLPLVVETLGGVGQPTYVPKGISLNLTNTYNTLNVDSRYDSTGVLSYGDGTAKANASFLNGLAISQGQYLDTSGQLSSYDVIQSSQYNKFTYEITLEKEIAKYRNTLLNLLHPTGMQVIGRFAMKGSSSVDYTATGELDTGHTLGYYTGDPGSYATMTTDYVNQSNNIVTFGGLVGANLENIIIPGDMLLLTTPTGFEIYSEVLSVMDGGANTVTLKDSPWLTFANVAQVTANAGSDVINISSLTGSYDIVNDGNYSDLSNPLIDIVYPGDFITVANNSEKLVIGVTSNTITLGSNLSNTVNSLMSVRRTVYTTNVQIFGAVGEQYFPELTDENGNTIITEDGRIILLG